MVPESRPVSRRLRTPVAEIPLDRINRQSPSPIWGRERVERLMSTPRLLLESGVSPKDSA